MDIIKLVNAAIASHSYNPLHEVLMKTWQHWEFPGGIVVRIHGFQCCGAGSTPDRETDPTDQAVWQKNPPRQKIGSINLWCVS